VNIYENDGEGKLNGKKMDCRAQNGDRKDDVESLPMNYKGHLCEEPLGYAAIHFKNYIISVRNFFHPPKPP
jgi:hypothetical protein